MEKMKRLALTRDTVRRSEGSLAGERELAKAVGAITGTCYRLSYCTCTGTRY